METTIIVTDEDIIKGVVGKCVMCPVALAVTRVLKPKHKASVRYNDLDIFKEYEIVPLVNLMLPTIASDFIAGFDRHHLHAQPFNFTLDIPTELLA